MFAARSSCICHTPCRQFFADFPSLPLLLSSLDNIDVHKCKDIPNHLSLLDFLANFTFSNNLYAQLCITIDSSIKQHHSRFAIKTTLACSSSTTTTSIKTFPSFSKCKNYKHTWSQTLIKPEKEAPWWLISSIVNMQEAWGNSPMLNSIAQPFYNRSPSLTPISKAAVT